MGSRAYTSKGELTEAALLSGIVRAARQLGWLCYHTWNSIHSAGGFPDLVLVRGKSIIYAELKGARGKASDAQLDWLTALQAAGAEVWLVRPSDYDGFVERLAAMEGTA